MSARNPYIFTAAEYVRMGMEGFWYGIALGVVVSSLVWIVVIVRVCRAVSP
jgi:hypothetical protein